MNDTAKAIAAYEKLTQGNPDDTDAQLALAGLYQQVSNYDEARKRLARVRAADSKNVDALLASGKVEIDAGNPQAGLEFLNSAYSLATQFGNDEAKASVEQQMGAAYLDLNKLDEALKNFTAALEIRKKLGLERGIASSLNMIARVQNKLGNSAEALANYKESLSVFQRIGDKRSTAIILMNLGSYYSDHANYDEALKSTNDALTLFRDLGDEANQALCLNNLGTIRSYMDNFQDALTYYQQAYNIREKLKLTDDMAESLHNLAETNVELGQYDTAVEQYLKALEIRRNSGDQNGVAINSSSLGALFAEQGKYGQALSALQESLKDFQQTNDQTWLMVEAMGRYGNALSEVGRWDEGQKNLEDAVRLATEVKNDTVLAQAMNYLGDSYFYRGDYGAARQQYDKALQVATKSKSRELLAVSRFNLAKLDVVQGRSGSAIPALEEAGGRVRIAGTAGAVGAVVDLSGPGLAGEQETGGRATGIGPRHEPRRKTRSAGGTGEGPLPVRWDPKCWRKDQGIRSAVPGSGSDSGVDQQGKRCRASSGSLRSERHVSRRRQVLPGRRIEPILLGRFIFLGPDPRVRRMIQ